MHIVKCQYFIQKYIIRKDKYLIVFDLKAKTSISKNQTKYHTLIYQEGTLLC